ncbi:hypothetical protein [Myxococcus sp. CA040A]|uniref:hypothetical protein n=1 Tax=Myxococcus sp. CA040A TaxID=2741738 RepID=UPI00157A426F|nr:hypothetical protein [Myxococcus sp. CA040A]NTX08275.1 hypothetical protein [Myxococcus sp. CA040A]
MSTPTWPEKLAAIRTRHVATTKGPWFWFGYLGSNEVGLHGRGASSVMEFHRWGMQSAQPVFSVDGILHNMSELVVPDTSVGRGRVTDIANPDARFLAASWEDVRDLLARVDELEGKVAAQVAPSAPTVWQYVVRTEAGDWLADVVLRSDGSFFALSDWGGYGFRWTSTGSSCFRSWASRLDVGYVAGKLGVNTAKARVVDAFTAAVWPRLVLMLRAELAAEQQAQPQAVAS